MILLPEVLLAVLFGCFIGISLGLTGGGGSLFAIPLLIYGLGLTLTEAVPISLIAVASAAAVGALYSCRAGLLIWQPIMMFSAGGIIGAPVGINIAPLFDESTLIVSFSILTLVIGIVMWRKSIAHPDETRVIRAMSTDDNTTPICKLSHDGRLTWTTPCAIVLMLSGIITGLLSGLFGVGGGFLIVPALMVVIELGVHRAVAASLMIITFIGISGSLSALWKGDLEWSILIPFILGSIIGMLLGRLFAAQIAGPALQRIFATGILIIGSSMLLRILLN